MEENVSLQLIFNHQTLPVLRVSRHWACDCSYPVNLVQHSYSSMEFQMHNPIGSLDNHLMFVCMYWVSSSPHLNSPSQHISQSKSSKQLQWLSSSISSYSVACGVWWLLYLQDPPFCIWGYETAGGVKQLIGGLYFSVWTQRNHDVRPLDVWALSVYAVVVSNENAFLC